jgi:hypothetical protein
MAMSNWTINLHDFYEPSSIKTPINQGSIVTSGKHQFTTERWQVFKKDQWHHCFVFLPLVGTKVKPFAKKPSELIDLIRNNSITVELNLWPAAFTHQQNTGRS